MKNFPSALIRQQNTKQGLGSNLGDTLQNIGQQALGNIFGSNKIFGSKKDKIKTTNDINNEFNVGYERFDLEHEIESIENNSFINFKDNEEYSNISNKYNFQIDLKGNTNNGKEVNNDVYFEDPFMFSSSIFSVINNYKYIFKHTIPSLLSGPVYINDEEAKKAEDEKSDDRGESAIVLLQSITSPSLFNPLASVNVTGIVENVPLINDNYNQTNTNNNQENTNDNINNINIELTDISLDDKEAAFNGTLNDKKATLDGTLDAKEAFNNENEKNQTIDNTKLKLQASLFSEKDLSDCTIKKLVELSNENQDNREHELGLATYRYVDFMFCKDLGKLPNNHLITLRRFPGPIGDNIFIDASPFFNQNSESGAINRFKSYPDIGHLVTWFGNEDNKLENICKYQYRATFKEFRAEIQQESSQQKNEGLFNQIANTFSPQNNTLISKGFSANTGLLGWGAQQLHIPILSSSAANNNYYDYTLLGNYDAHKIYEPANTIWDTHKYEGRLEFSQDITIVFRYKLRSYANINPKSAFLDLIGNIQAVTYRRGSFWGGESKIIGPQGNANIYDRGNAFIDKTFDKLGGIWHNLTTNSGDLLTMLQGWLSNALNGAVDSANKILNDASGQAGGNGDNNANNPVTKTKKEIERANKKYHFTDAIKGMLKNQLGRPAMYALNSLLTGEEVGPWHLTIGNPRNPIMSIGNLIMTNSELEHNGPLGIDDFPTELKLTVSLKHGRPRDSVEIQKMYTKGNSAIYRPMNLIQIKQYDNNANAFGDIIKYTSNQKVLEHMLRNI